MPSSAPFLLALVLAASCAAWADDPLQSADCRAALAALQAAEEAAAPQRPPGDAAAGPATRARLEALRGRAARACLGSRADPPQPGRRAQPPLAVPPVTVLPDLPARPARPPETPPPPQIPQPPLTVTGCDALGCWASDGTRLQRNGPWLLGPRGFCHEQGGLLQCP